MALAAPARSPLRIVCRSYGGENTKPRPGHYDKRVALLSLVRAARGVDPAPELVFVNDGPVPPERRAIMDLAGEVVTLRAGSNRRSYRSVVAREASRAAAGGDQPLLVWFAEDDYLYRPEAFVELVRAARALPDVGYFALAGSEGVDQDAPRRAARPRARPGAEGDPRARALGRVSWFRALACASTFGVRPQTLREDARLLRLCPYTGGAWDTATCLTYQGRAPFGARDVLADLRVGTPRTVLRGLARAAVTARSHRRPSRRRVLMSSDPELAAHLEVPEEHPRTPPSRATARTDWPALAAEVLRWARTEGLDPSPPAGRPGPAVRGG